ncbi:hypothetical protein L2E82_36472 [Cichorium intybus]|uniref:Uncharacterized protein n=1 Tax=Cichorium intybus TaxID=13427 RepID=A0ACB9BRM6_CICIN|nr:hypothetical protein L2E82_36472 [Cichorium intybus]
MLELEKKDKEGWISIIAYDRRNTSVEYIDNRRGMKFSMAEEKEAANTQVSELSTTDLKEKDENTLNFLDSVDNYLILIESLTSTLRQGWLELASARHSMGGSRVNTSLLTLKHHSAATKVEVNYDNGGSITKSPQLTLCKWASSDKKDSSFEDENIDNKESTKESNGSETTASPIKTENHLQKERGKVLSMFGALVSPKLRASQLSFETALDTLVEIANVRSSILETHHALLQHKVKPTKSTEE